MVKQCCISLCKRTSKDNKETSFFEIPSGEERRKLWISILEPYAKIGRQAYVCSKHFNFEDIRVFDNGRKRLISNAVPIINMEVCVVRDCESKAPFHALSIAPALREKWLINLDRLDLLDSTVDSSLKVCSAHFRSSSYSYPGSKRLLRSAIPEPLVYHRHLMRRQVVNHQIVIQIRP